MSFSKKEAISLKKINGGYVINVESDMDFDEALRVLKNNLIAHSKLLSGEVIIGVHNHHFDSLQKGRLMELFSEHSGLSIRSLECIDMYEAIDKKNDEIRKKRSFKRLDKFRMKSPRAKSETTERIEPQKVEELPKPTTFQGVHSTEMRKAPEIPVNTERADFSTLFHRGTIRSGNILQSKGHLVVIGDVNEGAELYAVGNIVVMGALKGMAHAGCEGDDNAFIIANQLKSTQIRISKHISIKADEDFISDKLRIAEIVDDSIVIK